MAKKKKSSGLKQVRVGYARAWKRPSIKLIHLLVFAFVFVWLGHQLLSSKAENIIPTGADEMVLQYDPLNNYQISKAADGTVLNALPPGEVIVTGDGSLYCNASGNGMVTRGNMGQGVLKQLFDQVNAPDVRQVSNNQRVNPPDLANSLDSAATVTVYKRGDGWGVTSVGDTSGAFARVANILQHKCQGEYATNRITELPVFQDVNMEDAPQDAVTWLKNTVFAPAFAGVTTTYNATETSTMIGNINSHRSSHYGLAAYKEGGCIESFSVPYYSSLSFSGKNYGAKPWTYHMGYYQSLAHDPNLLYEANWCSSNITADSATHTNQKWNDKSKWWAYGQNVGYAPSVSGIFNGYLNSCKHHPNIDDRSITWNGLSCSSYKAGYNRMGNAVEDDANGRRWSTTNFGGW